MNISMKFEKVFQNRDIAFWDKLKITDAGCWEYQGYISKYGYGHIKRSEFVRQVVGTHRYAYYLAYGEIHDGLFVCHECDNRSCCNPEHLWLGTQQDNMKDAYNKGRNYKKHNKEDIARIKVMCDQGCSLREISEKLDNKLSTVGIFNLMKRYNIVKNISQQ